MANDEPSRKASADVVIVGGGVIGLSVALLAGRRGMRVRVVDSRKSGAASAVAAGLLAPSLGRLEPRAGAAFRDARDRYDDFLDLVRESSGDSGLRVGRGILELPDDRGTVLNEAGDPDAIQLTTSEIARRFPELAPASAGVMHPRDGWIDPVGLLRALEKALPFGVILDSVEEVERLETGLRLRTTDQRWISCDRVVIASGVWSPLIKGFAISLPISPAKGEVMLLEGAHTLTHAVASGSAYLAPRANGIVVGSTFEPNRLDPTPTDQGQATLLAYANRLAPGLVAHARVRRAWAGIRPMTPDRLPIVDADPRDPRIIYACGHGKNGLLLAGLTAEMVLDLLEGNRLDPASPFGIRRFQ